MRKKKIQKQLAKAEKRIAKLETKLNHTKDKINDLVAAVNDDQKATPTVTYVQNADDRNSQFNN
jgi:uncharacterized coiled-coil protein SlyX